MPEIQTGDHVTAVMENSAPIGGATQEWTFKVEEVENDVVRGTDHMDDECWIDFSTDVPRYHDSGKEGDCVEVRVHEPHEDGGYWGNKYEVVYEGGA